MYTKLCIVFSIILAATLIAGCGDNINSKPLTNPSTEAATTSGDCKASLPYYEDGKAYKSGGKICTAEINGQKCEVLYAQTIVPKDNERGHMGWAGAKKRYVPVDVIKCADQ